MRMRNFRIDEPFHWAGYMTIRSMQTANLVMEAYFLLGRYKFPSLSIKLQSASSLTCSVRRHCVGVTDILQVGLTQNNKGYRPLSRRFVSGAGL